MADGTDVVVVLTTLGDEAAAAAFVGALLERRLVACGTLLPGARSLYRWDGRVTDAAETVVLLKTTAARLGALEAAFPALHPYEVPELLVLPAATGLPAYLDWVRTETASAASGDTSSG